MRPLPGIQVARLQWGHGLVAVEIAVQEPEDLFLGVASMGPRPRGRGDSTSGDHRCKRPAENHVRRAPSFPNLLCPEPEIEEALGKALGTSSPVAPP
jgi:hypothetical protein